jgi:glucokinase
MNTLAFDVGGTKVLGGVVSDRGEILEQVKFAVPVESGPAGVAETLAEEFFKLKKKWPEIRSTVGLSSAGPLDPERGQWLSPTNLLTNGQHWPPFAVTDHLQSRTGFEWRLENDAAAAVLAEGWVGQAQGLRNFIVVTLGTGVGVGVVCNGQLVRSGRGLHPEAAHMIINNQETKIRCGCGNLGCAEAYLSGANFARTVSARFGVALTGAALTGQDLLQRARSGDRVVLKEFAEYSRNMATFLVGLVVLFSPEAIVFAGGFSEAAPYFLPDAERALTAQLATRRAGVDLLPRLLVSEHTNDLCLLGAARVVSIRP